MPIHRKLMMLITTTTQIVVGNLSEVVRVVEEALQQIRAEVYQEALLVNFRKLISGL